MRIECDHCHAVFKVPDEKIPADRPFKATCSRCKQPIVIDRRQKAATDGSEVQAQVEMSATPAEIGDAPTAISVDLGIDAAYDSPLEVLEEGVLTALVCVDEPARLSAVKAALADLNYHCSLAASVKEALSKLRYNQYDLVVLDEEFCGEDAKNNTILRYLQPMPMSTRRRIFLLLISKEIRTLDNLMAFAKSVNAVVNTDDLSKVKVVLERALADHRRFYKVFMDSLQTLGLS